MNTAGYKLFKEGHVHNLFTSLSHDTCFIKAKCLPEMKKDCVYELKLQISIETSSVEEAECTCPSCCGPTGSCKHIAALCFAMEILSELEILLCRWRMKLRFLVHLFCNNGIDQGNVDWILKW